MSRITQQPPEKKEGEKESKYECVCVSGSHNPLSISTHIFFLHSTPHLCHILLCYTLNFPLKISLFTTLKAKNNPSLLFWFKSLIQWFYFKGCIHLLWSECFEDRHIFVAVPLWTLQLSWVREEKSAFFFFFLHTTKAHTHKHSLWPTVLLTYCFLFMQLLQEEGKSGVTGWVSSLLGGRAVQSVPNTPQRPTHTQNLNSVGTHRNAWTHTHIIIHMHLPLTLVSVF